MTVRKRKVTTKLLHEAVNAQQAKAWLQNMDAVVHGERPRLVLDCSQVRNMDSNMIYLLLCCLEEAMKHNGDVKLAGLTPQSRRMLSATRTERLFEIWPTEAEAVASFHRPALTALSRAAHRDEQEIAEHAA